MSSTSKFQYSYSHVIVDGSIEELQAAIAERNLNLGSVTLSEIETTQLFDEVEQMYQRINWLQNKHQAGSIDLRKEESKESVKTSEVAFEASYVDTIAVTRTVKENQSGIFSLSKATIRTLLIGSKIYTDKQSIPTYRAVVNTITNLSLMLVDAHDGNFSRKEVEQMRLFVEARLTHCEAERAEELNRVIETNSNKGNFNQDTYISMKLLLLDIREWLMGEVVL